MHITGQFGLMLLNIWVAWYGKQLWRNHRTFIIKPESNSLVDIVQHRDGYGKQHLRQVRAEERCRARFDVDVDPALQLQDAPQCGKYCAQADTNHWKTDQVAEQVALPWRIEWLITTSHWTPYNTTLDNNNTGTVSKQTIKLINTRKLQRK